MLRPLGEAGLFFVDGAPSRRVRFESGALIMLGPDGSAARQARNSPAAQASQALGFPARTVVRGAPAL